MALSKPAIKASIITALQQPFNESTSSSSIQDQFADKLADVIISAIQSSRLTIPSGTITTTGSATTQTQSAPAIIDNGLS